jgi:hypothetical protein
VSVRGRCIAIIKPSAGDEPFPDLLVMATAVLLLFLISVVAIAAFLATAAPAAAGDACAQAGLSWLAAG